MAHIPGHPSASGQVVPPTGLIGLEQAVGGGLSNQLGLLAHGIGGAQGEIDIATGQAREDVGRGFNQGIQTIDPFVQGGAEASQLQAAQSGALGPEAQAQAFQSFEASPGQQFLQQEAERAVLRNAGATGQLGGGNVLRELQQQAIGLAQQDFQNQFGRLGQVAGTGQQAAGTQAGLQVGRGRDLGGIAERGGANLADLSFQGGVLPAQAVGQAAGQVGQGRFITGQQIAQAAGGTAAGQANFQNQQGAGLSDIFGQGNTNLANLTSGTGSASSNLTQNLGTILANIGTGAGSQAAGFTTAAAQFDASGIMGQNTAVQNTLQQLLQLIPQGGSSQPPPAAGANFGGGTTPAFNAGAIA